jgi:hypothetical protein
MGQLSVALMEQETAQMTAVSMEETMAASMAASMGVSMEETMAGWSVLLKAEKMASSMEQ